MLLFLRIKVVAIKLSSTLLNPDDFQFFDSMCALQLLCSSRTSSNPTSYPSFHGKEIWVGGPYQEYATEQLSKMDSKDIRTKQASPGQFEYT